MVSRGFWKRTKRGGLGFLSSVCLFWNSGALRKLIHDEDDNGGDD